MPRYFFHVRKDGGEPDTTGVDLANSNEARIEASRCLGEEMLEHPYDLWEDGEWYIDVADESGLILFSMFSATFEAASSHTGIRSRPGP